MTIGSCKRHPHTLGATLKRHWSDTGAMTRFLVNAGAGEGGKEMRTMGYVTCSGVDMGGGGGLSAWGGSDDETAAIRGRYTYR